MSSEHVGYHRTYTLSDRNELVEQPVTNVPLKGSVAAELEVLRERQRNLNERLSSAEVEAEIASAPSQLAGIYPLKVVDFTCSCEGNDEDEAATQLADRLGNLRIITQVPFMRRGNVIFAIRSQGLLDPETGEVECVDALFGGGIYWRGRLTPERFDYELLMFKSGKDQFVGRMSESIDLTRKVGDIDPGLYQAEVGYHLDRESNDRQGLPTLARSLDVYGRPGEMDQIVACYAASAAFGVAVKSDTADLPALAAAARIACTAVPGKRYYQAYEAWLHGLGYDPTKPS